ncbi:hypothetical protein V6N11_084016 [Hibiscus sabdariffa]|uniref:Uncharacterized protein n=1 Tax=Hibiscus sabdariffa TaxID=183260 RepID=A0ABR2QDJ7_9ROSI
MEVTKRLDMRVFDSQEELVTGVSKEDTSFVSRNDEGIRRYGVMKCVVKRKLIVHEPKQQSGPNEMNVLNSHRTKIITYKGVDRKVKDMSELMLSFLSYNEKEVAAKEFNKKGRDD